MLKRDNEVNFRGVRVKVRYCRKFQRCPGQALSRLQQASAGLSRPQQALSRPQQASAGPQQASARFGRPQQHVSSFSQATFRRGPFLGFRRVSQKLRMAIHKKGFKVKFSSPGRPGCLVGLPEGPPKAAILKSVQRSSGVKVRY